jgi:type II secretory ATPase GspE/PulE/Tfp pilus assembly ATPase PilB-like protein
MRVRDSKIIEGHAKTFEWVLEKPSFGALGHPKFRECLKCRGGLYWIAGKAGSGKSTLMKYLFSHS